MNHTNQSIKLIKNRRRLHKSPITSQRCIIKMGVVIFFSNRTEISNNFKTRLVLNYGRLGSQTKCFFVSKAPQKKTSKFELGRKSFFLKSGFVKFFSKVELGKATNFQHLRFCLKSFRIAKFKKQQNKSLILEKVPSFFCFSMISRRKFFLFKSRFQTKKRKDIFFLPKIKSV